jgi:hypothetical protein
MVVTLLSCDDQDTTPKTQVAKLDYYIDAFQQPGEDFQATTQVKYSYNASGLVEKYTVYSYDETSAAFKAQRYVTISWSGSQATQIKEFLQDATQPYITHQYEYDDSQLRKITELNSIGQFSSQASFSYVTPDSVAVNYSFSNGNSFVYGFRYQENNIVTDRTLRLSQTCSQGSYAYDEKRNPFNALGYTDFLLLNFSANNKLSENVNYMACAFPELIPLSYEYTYNESGFPSAAITNYKTSGPVAAKSKRTFFYKTN